VDVDGAPLQMLENDVDSIRQAEVREPLALLPGFDPYILGHASRDHLYARQFASRVSRTAGWISAVVLLNGEVVGTWTHAIKNGTLQMTVTPFRRLSASVMSDIKKRATIIAEALSAERTEVRFA
jgi:hypothetical protein